LRSGYLALLVAACAVGFATCGRSEPQARAGRPESGPPELAAVGDGTEPALDPTVAAYALERAGRPVVGMVLACPHVVPQAPLTEAEREMLGDAAAGLGAIPFPEVAEMAPTRVTWKPGPDDAEPLSDWAFAFRAVGATLYVTPWLEVLCDSGGLATGADPAQAADVVANGLGGEGAGEGPVLEFGGAWADWGHPSPAATEALRACLLARLGDCTGAAETASAAGTDGFAALPTMLTYLGHKMTIEGLADGWSHEWAWWTAKAARDLEAPYAGRELLEEVVATLDMMKNESHAPPDFPLDEDDPRSTNVPRYHLWRLRYAGGPPEARPADEHGDPVTRLLNGGPGTDGELVRALRDPRMTRQLVTDPDVGAPDVLRFRDLALDLLNARLGLDLLQGLEATRVSELSPEELERVIAEADAAGKRVRVPE